MDRRSLSKVFGKSKESGIWTAPSRSVDTVYQNTSGKKRRVSVYVNVINAATEAKLLVGPTSTPAMVIAGGRMAGTVGNDLAMTLNAEVPNQWYYNLETSVGSPTIREWHELDE